MGFGGQGSRSNSCCYRRAVPGHQSPLHLLLPCLVALCCASGSMIRGAEGYKNYTVADSLGWYDKLEQPKVDYQKWADARNFSLGDFLIFNSDRNHSVVQTYNATTYKSCSYDDALDSDTRMWSAGGAPSFDSTPATVEVPLVKEGPNYFFSGDYDGEQCRNGQRFQINVTHGQGLPESLRTPEPEAPSPDAEDDGSAPDTNLPENFDHPKEMQAATGTDSSGAAPAGLARSMVVLVVAFAAALQLIG